MKFVQFLKDLWGEGRGELLLSLFTPTRAEHASGWKRALLAGGSMVMFGAALLAAVNAAVLLMFCLGMMYYLLAHVLGIKLDFDPRVLVREAQRYASSSAPN